MSAQPEEIILYDLPTRTNPPTTWSLNPWKARLSLNYKSLPYKTEFVEYPDLQSHLSSLGVEPHAPGTESTAYTAPAVRLPNGSYVMESFAIAQALEKLQPEPSLHLDSPMLPRVRDAMRKALMKGLGYILIPRVPRLLLPERSREYFERTRRERFGGLTCAEAEKSEEYGAGKQTWENAEVGLRELAELLGENPEGPFLMGKEPSFADFVMVGLWRFVEMLSEDGDLSEKIIGFDEKFGKQLEACRPWLAKEV